MKLSSAMAVGVLTVLTVVGLPVRLDEGRGLTLRQLDLSTLSHPANLANEAVQNAARQAKRPARLAELNLNQLLGQLQRNVAISGTPSPTTTARQQMVPAASKVRGIKRVDAESSETAGQDYAIPSGDIFLDRGAVGETSPDDASVR